MAAVAHPPAAPLITPAPLPSPAPAPAPHHSPSTSIPIIDVGALFLDTPAPPEVRNQLVQHVVDACETWGFLQLINHCVPLELMDNTFAHSKAFFDLPDQDKEAGKQKPDAGAPVRTGFIDDDLYRGEIARRERLTFFFGDSPHKFSKYNVWPGKPEHLRETVEAYAAAAKRMCLVVLELVSEGLGVTPEQLTANYKSSDDMLMVHHYPPSSKGEMGAPGHTDANTLTLLVQDDVGGLEVLKDGEWRPVPPIKGAIIMNIGDVLQVWSNLRYKSVFHRVKNDPNRHRYSIPFFSNPPPNIVVQPLSKCTTEIGVPPKYRPFEYKEYLLHRLNNRKITSPDVEEIHVSFYAI